MRAKGRWMCRVVLSLLVLLLASAWTVAPQQTPSVELSQLETPIPGWMPSWSPDGRELAFVREDGQGNSDIYIHDLVGGAERRLTRDPALDLWPRWSPDGKFIAFYSSRDGNFELYRVWPDGSHLERLTYDPAIDWEPAWTPDGRLVFESYRDGWPELYLLGLGGAVKRLTQDFYRQAEPTVAPDGRRVAFASLRDGNWDIYVMRIDKPEMGQVRLTDSPEIERYPAWSPDGHRLAYTAFHGEAADIYVFDFTTGAISRLTADDHLDLQPAWSPDGTAIAYASLRDSGWEILIIPAQSR